MSPEEDRPGSVQVTANLELTGNNIILTATLFAIAGSS
jgi:hypothetical protein